MIRFENVSKSYGNQLILKNLTFELEEGEFLVLVGPSGSGKTTTLKMFNRLIDPSQGAIFWDNTSLEELNLRKLRLDTGYVLQQIALFPNLTVKENIELIPEMKGWSSQERLKKTEELLDKVGLSPQKYLNRYPKDLSGGEQQRVGILRAIIAQPKLLLMDEPFSALDPISRKQLQELTKNLHQELGISIVFVTHDIEEAVHLADRIAVFKEGEIIQLDYPLNIQEKPENAFVADLFGGNLK